MTNNTTPPPAEITLEQQERWLQSLANGQNVIEKLWSGGGYFEAILASLRSLHSSRKPVLPVSVQGDEPAVVAEIRERDATEPQMFGVHTDRRTLLRLLDEARRDQWRLREALTERARHALHYGATLCEKAGGEGARVDAPLLRQLAALAATTEGKL